MEMLITRLYASSLLINIYGIIKWDIFLFLFRKIYYATIRFQTVKNTKNTCVELYNIYIDLYILVS